ncbi:RICIN domain-containing protein [Actinosynnema sp. NPDC053489]|uniref:RICIN domain-containing protein n=1 Tax=Actinosynnema sp. NPDC053489 TaxID=3363916 RepID=UPI0037C75202
MTFGIARKLLTLAASIALCGSLIGFAGTASAQSGVTIRNGGNARCLDADLGTIGTDGTKVQLWECHGDDNQLWTFEPHGLIRNNQSGRCLDAELAGTPHNGTKVQLWTCHGDENQVWDYDADRQVLVNYLSGRCLQADPGTANGTGVSLRDCQDRADQRWSFQAP